MKYLKLLSILLMLSAFGTTQAEDTGANDIEIKPIKNRPSDTSSDVNLHCNYMQGQLRFSFDVPEGKATLTVTCFETGEVSTKQFLTATPYYYYVGTESGTYTLNIKTAKNEYEGVLEIQ